ncbi:MafB2 adhesin [Candidatus Bodocaedibacter vickermanii]|uniref:MafB2 adhesin n=2 Tax=Candidatus Bodocaedibacter vickermanii TaxID=2741701 RepID=A0A7L9RUI5_9PROT|nr:MafB2 adhesin [Candidatus Paracaedibacteraceae bacterium 'Lake Konstanz']
MTSSPLFAAEELRVNDPPSNASNQRATVYSPASQTSKKSVPPVTSPNPALRPESVSRPGLYSLPTRALSRGGAAYPTIDPPCDAIFTVPRPGTPRQGSEPQTTPRPLPTGATCAAQTPRAGSNVRPASVAQAFGETARRSETEVRASRVSDAPSRMLDPISVPNIIPSIVFSTVNSQQQLELNLNINNRTISHTVDLINFSEIGQSQRFVSEEYVTTLTPDEGGIAHIHISRQGRRIAEGAFRVDSNKSTLLIERLVFEESFHINFAGKIIINRLETVSTDTAPSHLFLTSGSAVILGSDVNTNLNQLTINAKTFVQKGELRIYKLSASVEELINDGSMEIQEVVVLRRLKKLTNNASLYFSQPYLSIHVPEFVNDGMLLGNNIGIVSTKGRNSRLIKAKVIDIKCEGVFSNTGGEHDGLMLVDKNQPDGLWGIHGETIKIECKTLENDLQGIIWASKRIDGVFTECQNKGYIRCLEDVSITTRTYIDQAHAVQRRSRTGVTPHTKASLVAYQGLTLKVSDGTIQSSIYGEHAIELLGWSTTSGKLKNLGLISSPGVLLIKNLRLVNSGKIRVESRIMAELRAVLENKGDIESGSVKLHSLEHSKLGTFNCQELTLQQGDIAGLVSARKWIEIGGDVSGQGILKSNNLIRLAERIRDDISIQCKIEAKDIRLSTPNDLTLAQIVGEQACITARYFEIPARYLNDGSEAVKLKSLSITVGDSGRINIALPLSVSDTAVTFKADTITLGDLHVPLGLSLTAEKVVLNGNLSEETARKLHFVAVNELHIVGDFIAPLVWFAPTLHTLVIAPTGRIDVNRFQPNTQELKIHGTVNASGSISLEYFGNAKVLIKGSSAKKAIVSTKNEISFRYRGVLEMEHAEIAASNVLFGVKCEFRIDHIKIHTNVQVIAQDRLSLGCINLDVDESGGVSARQGNVFQGKTVMLVTQDGEMHYRLSRMGIRTLDDGTLMIVTNGELSLPAFEEGGFSFHHGHFKATKVNLPRVNEITIWSGDMTIEFQPDAPKIPSSDPKESPAVMFEIGHHTVILGKLTVTTPDSQVIIDPSATLDVRGGMRINSLRNRGTLISTGGDNYVAQKFLNHGKATLGTLDVWNFESSQKEWGRPNFKITGDLKIQRYFAMHGSNGWVDGSIIFHQGDSGTVWSEYSGFFILCPVRPPAETSWVTTRQEPSSIDRTKMNTYSVLRGDGRGSRLIVGRNIHSPEGRRLERLDIIASDLIVQSGVVDLDVGDAEKIMNLPGALDDPAFKTRVRADDFKLRVKNSRFDLREKKPEVLGDPTQSDALVLLGAQVEGFKMIVVRGKILAQLTPLIIDPRIAYSQDGAPRIEIHVLELSQALVDGLGRMGVSAQSIAATYAGVPRNMVTLFSAGAPSGSLGGQGVSPAAMLHVQTEMLHAVGIPYLNRDARNMGEDFALTAQESVLATVQAAGGRLGPLKVSLLVQEVGLARQTLMAIMSLIQQGDSRPLLVDDSSPVDLAKLEQMLDESELMREFKADIKEITGLHHELISVPEAQRIVRARQPVVDQIAREGLEPLELRPEEMSRFLEGGDRFYAERTLIDGRWVDLARISVSDATRRYWGSDFKGLKVGNNLHLTSQNGSSLFGVIEAQNDLIITVHSGVLELGPQDANTVSVIGGRRRTILHVKDGELLLHPGVKLLGQQVILMADKGIRLSPLVIETWRRKTESAGFLWLGSKTTTTKDISYKERLTLDDGHRGIIIYSKDGDVNVSGAHIGNQESPVVLLAGGNVLMGPLLTDTYHQVDDRGVFSRNTTTVRGQAVKATKISNIPNAVTLEKVLSNPQILEAILADVLGRSTEQHRQLLLTHKDARALRQGTAIIRAMGNVTGKAIDLATVFAEISAGGKIDLSAVDTMEETDSEGWSINFFGGLGQAICNLINSGSKEAVASAEQVAEADRNKAIAQSMGALTAVFSAIVEYWLQEEITKAIEDTPLREMQLWATAVQEERPTDLPKKIWDVVRPFAGVVTANFSGMSESIVNLARLGNQKHSLVGVGAAMTITQGVLEGFKMYEAMKSIKEHGFLKFFQNGFNGIKDEAYSIGLSFYKNYSKKKIQVPGEIKALFSLKMRAGSLLNITGTAMQSFLGDWRAKQIHVGGVKEGTQSRHESGGFSVNPVKLTASVHGEWGREQSVVYRPVYYHFNFLFVGEVDELHMYGGVIRASFGLGRIRKLVLHHKVDTGDQSGGGAGITFPLSPSAMSSGVMDNIKSLSVSISMGGMVRLNGGLCVFDVPGIKVDDWIDLDIPAVQYDNRTNITATVNNTTLGDAAPTGTTAIGSIGMQVGDVPVHMDVPSGIVPGHEGRTYAWHKRTFQELEAKASQRELDEEELKQLLHSKEELEKAAERRKAELLEKRKARTLTPEEAEELQPILDREAAERHTRQQAEVDRRKAEANQLVEERIAKEKVEEKRKELLRSKQRVGTLTPDERDELQDMLDRDAAQRAAQPAAGAAAAAAASAPQHVDPLGGGAYESFEIDEQTMQAITDFDRVLNQMTDPEKEQLDRALSVYDPNKGDAENAAAMEGLPEMKKLHERYSMLGGWTDADNLHPDKSLIDREIIEYHQKIKELEALPTTDSRRSAIEFYQEALDSKYEIKHSGRFAQGMVEGAKLSAEYMVGGYLGGVVLRVLKLGYLYNLGHQVYKAQNVTKNIFMINHATRQITRAERIGSALDKEDLYHRAASFLFDSKGMVHYFLNPKNAVAGRHLYQKITSLNGKHGIVEVLVNDAGKVVHQRFIPGGKIIPKINQEVAKETVKKVSKK